jgi:hypothetical protein
MARRLEGSQQIVLVAGSAFLEHWSRRRGRIGLPYNGEPDTSSKEEAELHFEV